VKKFISTVFSRKTAAWVLGAFAAVSIIFGCLGAERSLDLMRYYAAITAMGAFAGLSLLAAFRGKIISAKILHIGLGIVFAGWVYGTMTSPSQGVMRLSAEMGIRETLPDDNTQFSLDSFTIDRWSDTGTVRQYTSQLSLSNGSKAVVSVNNPLRWNGWWIYQNSYQEYTNPHTGKPLYFTILTCIKDTGLPYVAFGGLLLLIGSLIFAIKEAKIKDTSIKEKTYPHSRFLYSFYAFYFACAIAMLIHRTISTGHPPMQNMYEFLMCSAAFIPALTFLSNKIDKQNTLLVDSILTLIVMIPVGFAMDGTVKRLMPALQSPLFIPHVGAYVIGYLILVRAALGAGRRLIGVGFFLLTLGLVLGATWGKICWGNWWQFDPKEMWSLATWFVYSAYFHISSHLTPKQKTFFLSLGAIMIILTLTWINLSRIFTGMHSYA
jgi:ABC-type transport system involved in cytochrome c biogenesis permease subunit